MNEISDEHQSDIISIQIMGFKGDTKKSSAKINNEMKKKIKKTYSHLYFQDRHLKSIPKFSLTKDASVLYLYNNEITTIENIDALPKLTSLYLQNNKIERMENLTNLRGLKKLFVGKNRISVLEGLESFECLEELHIEKQYLPDSNALCVDPRTIFALSETLQILNIAHNNISSLFHLSPLKNLKVINASFNDLDDMNDICQTVRQWYHLEDASFTGNPFTKSHRYREEIIASSHRLQSLDGRNISDITRTFIKKFEEEKLLRDSRPTVNIADIHPSLPRNYPLSLQKAVSASILRKAKLNLLDDLSTFDEGNGAYIAWKTLPTRKPLRKHTCSTSNRRANVKETVSTNFLQIPEH